METEKRLRLAEVFVSITDPRQSSKVEHDLVELLVIAVNAVLVGADKAKFCNSLAYLVVVVALSRYNPCAKRDNLRGP